MFPFNSLDFEVTYRQQQVRTQFLESRQIVSISGIRHFVGSSLIAFGSSIYGKAQESCQDADASRVHLEAVMHGRRTLQAS